MAATVSSLLVKGEHQAAARLADSAAASISTSEEHDVRTHCVAVANYAITQVECLRERARSGEQGEQTAFLCVRTVFVAPLDAGPASSVRLSR